MVVVGRWRCSTSIFAFLPRFTIFLWPLLKTGHFQGIYRILITSKPYIQERFPPKDLEIFYSKIWYQTRMRACKLHHEDENSKLWPLSIKEMLVGGVIRGEVVVSNINFCLPSKNNFSFSLAFPHIGHLKDTWKNIQIFPTREET